jgi:hypothetical protein
MPQAHELLGKEKFLIFVEKQLRLNGLSRKIHKEVLRSECKLEVD